MARSKDPTFDERQAIPWYSPRPARSGRAAGRPSCYRGPVPIPFTQEEFFSVFVAYNQSVWPGHLLIYALAAGAGVLALVPSRRRSAVATGVLAFLWAWMAVAYHWLHFSRINPVAGAFGGLFLLQAALFLWSGILRGRLVFEGFRGARGWMGGLLIAYAMVLYPLLGLAFGHPLRELPILGVPCPTTILTLGLFFWARRPFPRYLLAIPLAWAAVGSTAAFALGVPQDLGLSVAGLLALPLLAPSDGGEKPMTRIERELLAGSEEPVLFREELVASLPASAQRYLLHAIAPGTPLAQAVRLETLFTMRLRPGSPRPVDLPGYEILAPPRGFVWRARGRMGPIPFRVADHYAEGEGAVRVEAFGGVPVVRASGADVSRSARGRLAIEAIWLPTALLPTEGVSWQGLPDGRCRVVLTIDGETLALSLAVDGDGGLREVTMERHGDVGVDSWRPIPYGVEVESEAAFGGYTIPTRLRGGWWYGTERYDPDAAARLRVTGASFV